MHEHSGGKRHEVREIEIKIRLFGAFHDGYLKLTYPNACAYSFNVEKKLRSSGHGDWITRLLQEIVLSTGRWTIEAAGLHWEWTPGP